MSVSHFSLGTSARKSRFRRLPGAGLTLGDETILLLEGEVDVVETLSGKEHHLCDGDVIGQSSGMHITWTSRGPFSKKLWVISKDQLPDS
ncbi:cupin domain-containing protein [uncultured Nevskia sp.]|uniref:cupin domain-containing protein n=1 Tax=uncultured Nevskia sp. TaxID=228950 RepID=UPI0025D88BE4|nr:cupin domain-containing protein [uncultured Nevskia sp.]